MQKGHMGGGDHYLYCKKVKHHTVDAKYVVGCTVGVSAKRSTSTLDLANMGGGDCYL